MFGFFKPKPLGKQGEAHAARYLRAQGYRILDRNVQLGRYEIDIIVLDSDTTVFVEVKTRATDDGFAPELNVNHEKQRRIIKAARQYISEKNNPDMYYRFDIVSVILPGKGAPTINHFKDAFRE